MTNRQFEKLVDDFFNLSSNSNYNYSYTPSKCAVELKDDSLNFAISVIGHDPKNVEVNLTTDKIYIKAKKDIEDKSISGQLIRDIDEVLHLTKDFDGLTAKAEIKNGVLSILVDKKEDQKPKKLSIKF